MVVVKFAWKNVNSYPFICVCIPVNYNKTANISVKKLQFNQVLTATCIEWYIENSKNDKKVIYSASHWRLGDVMMDNITFLSLYLPSTTTAIDSSLTHQVLEGLGYCTLGRLSESEFLETIQHLLTVINMVKK